MNSAPALSVVEHSYAPTADQGLEYYNGIVNFLESEENYSMQLSNLEQELEERGRELMRILLQNHLDKLGPAVVNTPVWRF